MTTKIETVDTQQEVVDRIYGYAESAAGSAKKSGPDAPAVHKSLGFIRSQIDRYFELSRQARRP